MRTPYTGQVRGCICTYAIVLRRRRGGGGLRADYVKACEELKPLAEQGHSEAQVNPGRDGHECTREDVKERSGVDEGALPGGTDFR